MHAPAGLLHVVYESVDFTPIIIRIEINLFLFLKIADGGVLRSIGDMVRQTTYNFSKTLF